MNMRMGILGEVSDEELACRDAGNAGWTHLSVSDGHMPRPARAK
jgi:hypothetical protein